MPSGDKTKLDRARRASAGGSTSGTKSKGAVFDFRRVSSTEKPGHMLRANKYATVNLKRLLQYDPRWEPSSAFGEREVFSSLEMKFVAQEATFGQYSHPWGRPELGDAEHQPNGSVAHDTRTKLHVPPQLSHITKFEDLGSRANASRLDNKSGFK